MPNNLLGLPVLYFDPRIPGSPTPPARFWFGASRHLSRDGPYMTLSLFHCEDSVVFEDIGIASSTERDANLYGHLIENGLDFITCHGNSWQEVVDAVTRKLGEFPTNSRLWISGEPTNILAHDVLRQ